MSIQRKKFRYLMLAAPGVYYYANNGAVSTTTTPTPLQKDPLQWRDTALQYKRHKVYHGVLRAFVVPLSFPKDGADILRHVYYTQGVEGKCTLQIFRLDPLTQSYLPYYEGDFDFSQTIDTRNYFQAAILDAGLAALLKAKENTVYELPILNSNSIPVLMDGVTLRGNTHYVVPRQGATPNPPIPLGNAMNIQFVNAEGINESTATSTSSSAIPGSSAITFPKAVIYTVKYAEAMSLSMKLSVFVSWPSSASSNVQFSIGIIYGQSPPGFNEDVIWAAPGFLAPGQSATYQIDTTSTPYVPSTPLNPGDSVSVVALMLDSGGNTVNDSLSIFQITDDNSVIDIATEYRRPPSVVLWRRPFDVFSDLITAMSGGAYTAASNYLNNSAIVNHDAKPFNTLLTAADAIRGLGDPTGTGVPAKIKMTLKDFDKDVSGRDMLGIGVEGTVARVEPLSYFYDNASPPLLLPGIVTKLQKKPATDYLWNTIKVGYNYIENDKLNGKDDPFLTAQFSTSGIRNVVELDNVSPVVASYVTHEYLRANLNGKPTTDSKSDNDTCVVEISGAVNSDGQYLISRRQNDPGNSISGVIAGATAYNLGLTFKRCLKRSGGLVNTNLHLQAGAVVAFQTATQNAELQSNLGSGNVIEKADEPASGLDGPPFIPIEFDFELPASTAIRDQIDANPYRRINFYALDNNGLPQLVGGFVLDVNVSPASNEAASWKLLCAPDVDPALIATLR